MQNKNEKTNYSSTPYDDVFRTMLVEGRNLIIPLINETFGESYTDEAEIIFNQNEHFITSEDGSQAEVITDSNFRIIYKGITKYYHYECQSNPDSTILIRIFEYDTKIAIENSVVEDNVMTITFPNSAVLYLRATANIPDTMKVVIKVPKLGTDGEYYVKVVKAVSYSIDDIFEKKLWFLIPFHIFSYEKSFKSYEDSETERENLIREYEKIKVKLEKLAEEKVITDFQKIMILDMSKKVVDYIAEKYSNVKEGVKKIMGGQILDFEAKRIRDDARQEGRIEGRLEGRQEGRLEGMKDAKDEMIIAMRENGIPEEQIKLIISFKPTKN